MEARIEEFKRDETYRFFVTESLRLAPQRKIITKSYRELLTPQHVDVRTGKEIVMDVMKKAGLKFGG